MVKIYIKNAQDFYRRSYYHSHTENKQNHFIHPFSFYCDIVLETDFVLYSVYYSCEKSNQMHKIDENIKIHVILNRCYSHIPSNKVTSPVKFWEVKHVSMEAVLQWGTCVVPGWQAKGGWPLQGWHRKHNLTCCVRSLLCMAAFGGFWE